MARDEALLNAAARGAAPALRLYGWIPPTLSLGAHQPASDADLEACRSRGIDLVRRPTGGGAVLHDRELTYAVAGRIGDPPFPSSVIAIYEGIASALLMGLAQLGIAAQASRGALRGRAPADCFGAPSARELVVRGRKLAGSAQLRRRGAFLQHGSILLALDSELLAALLTPGRAGARPATPTSISELLGREASWDEVARAIVRGFGEALGADLEPGALTDEEAEEAERLRAWKYLDALWTLEGRVRGACPSASTSCS